MQETARMEGQGRFGELCPFINFSATGKGRIDIFLKDWSYQSKFERVLSQVLVLIGGSVVHG